MTTVEVFAPAKINLTLHVTGQRDDGYHLLDSLVVFTADVGDVIRVRSAEFDNLSVEGPFSAGLPINENNLVRRAASLMGQGFDITLEKNLPVASGIGGGSSDAAATLQAISKLRNMPLPSLAEQMRLGADVPVCVMGGVVRMQGVGEHLTPIDVGEFTSSCEYTFPENSEACLPHSFLNKPSTNWHTHIVLVRCGSLQNVDHHLLVAV